MDISKYFLFVSCCMVLGFQGCGGSSAPNDDSEEIDNPTKTLYITTKTEFSPDENITTTYTYHDNYLSRINQQSTEGWTDKKTYKYFENYQVMKTYDVRDNVESITIFENSNSQTDNNLYNRRLSFDKDVAYMFYTNDTVTHHNFYQIKKLITINTTGNVYIYNDDNLLTKIENGSFEDNNSNAIDQLSNDANTSYLLSTTNTPLTFLSSQETRYNYNNDGVLNSIIFDGQSGTLEAEANVTFYTTGDLKELALSTGDKFIYSVDGYLTTRTVVQNGITAISHYTYSSDLKTVTVKDENGAIAQQYTFNELN